MSRIVDIRLLASAELSRQGQRVAVVLDDQEQAVAVHLERSRLTVAELEELWDRVCNGNFETEES